MMGLGNATATINPLFFVVEIKSFLIIALVLVFNFRERFMCGGINALLPQLFVDGGIPQVLDLIVCSTRQLCNNL